MKRGASYCGAIVAASIINAPSSTKKAQHACDPEMHRATKGNEWRFDMKVPIGVDAGSGAMTAVEATADNV